MSHVYVLTNQHQQFLSKSNDWIDGRDSARLFRTEYKDVAINQMFEANTRDVALRIELLECGLDSKKNPQIPADALSDEPLCADDNDTGEAAEESGDPEELPQPDPSEAPPEYNPEVDPEPAPEVEPDSQPEIDPDEYPGDTPEIEPGQPPESIVGQP
ncbi:hypothetical protein [Microbulbifer pacificus]|uniref:hypothetical protein n=1 Tax=Microbulbifer pacificus TaxID=407164 RepID=UPI000CF39DB5|nr:hypothetical protein [Microbulbifer pacificus]